MKKYRIELTMACLLLVCFYLLSRQAAVISVNQTERGTQKAASPLILVDAGIFLFRCSFGIHLKNPDIQSS